MSRPTQRIGRPPSGKCQARICSPASFYICIFCLPRQACIEILDQAGADLYSGLQTLNTPNIQSSKQACYAQLVDNEKVDFHLVIL